MKNYTIQLLDTLSDKLEQRMRADLFYYESSHEIEVNYHRFALAVTLHNGEVVGVLNAYTAYAEVYIDDMWVDAKYRGKGYGRALIQKLEQMFQGKGFNNINLVTSAFQAPEFYKKCGFTLEFVRQNKKNPKFTKYFFVKYFDNEIQNQGLL